MSNSHASTFTLTNRRWPHRRLPVLIGATVVLAATTTLAACTSKASGASVKVTSKSDACELSVAKIASGKTTFEVTNSGGDATEVYVYGEGNRIMGEVENIGPGSTRSFVADLGGGKYEVACKPGQKGDGIRTELEVTGAVKESAAPSRTVEVTATEWGYTGLDFLLVKEGETIEFEMKNVGTVDHEMEILDPDGNAVGEIGPTPPGTSAEVIVTFHEAGEWAIECGIAGHLEHGMKRTVTVTS